MTALEQLQYQELGRFQIKPEPLQAFPNKCMICGRYGSNSPEHPLHFVDFGIHAEFLGNLYLCVEGCFREIANQLGCFTREQSIAVQQTLQNYKNRVTEQELEIKELTHALDALNRVNSALHLSDQPVTVVTVGQEEQSEISARVDPEPNEREQGSTEQIDERGSTDVHDDEDGGSNSEWDI